MQSRKVVFEQHKALKIQEICKQQRERKRESSGMPAKWFRSIQDTTDRIAVAETKKATNPAAAVAEERRFKILHLTESSARNASS